MQLQGKRTTVTAAVSAASFIAAQPLPIDGKWLKRA